MRSDPFLAVLRHYWWVRFKLHQETRALFLMHQKRWVVRGGSIDGVVGLAYLLRRSRCRYLKAGTKYWQQHASLTSHDE